MQLLLAQSGHSTDPSAGALAAMAAMSGVFLLGGLVFTVFMIWIYYLILKKAGMNPWLSLLMLVPLAGFVVLLILAFGEWPIERENRALRAQLGLPPSGAPPGATIVQT
jgi:energy-coupling factor transporter transmembrane protein EcfT